MEWSLRLVEQETLDLKCMEVLTGPTGSGPSPLGGLLVPTDQYIYGHSNWCHTRFTVDPSTQSILVEFVGDDGVVFDDYVITQS